MVREKKGKEERWKREREDEKEERGEDRERGYKMMGVIDEKRPSKNAISKCNNNI